MLVFDISFYQISEGTGASRYLIRRAKLSSFNEIRDLKTLLFLRYLSRLVLIETFWLKKLFQA